MTNVARRQPESTGPSTPPRNARGWLERLWTSIADRGRKFAQIPANSIEPLERARLLAASLLSERGEASGAAIARELIEVLDSLTAPERGAFMSFLATGFQADEIRLTEASRAYLDSPSPKAAARLAQAAEPPRLELLRRMNMAEGGTSALVGLRKELAGQLGEHPELAALDADLRHLFVSWFNRGFLQLRQIDWQTPAAILEKLIAYEAVHEIQGWDDLRRRLAPDRCCFAFFHPALPGEPLIFVEVALVVGLSGSVRALLERDADEMTQKRRAIEADTAIFYSISNCQDGLRGISFGNFLIKQVVEELRAERPGLRHFSTLSPVPGFRRWLDARLAAGSLPEINLSADQKQILVEAAAGAPDSVAAALAGILADDDWQKLPTTVEAVKTALLRLCACYLTANSNAERHKQDPVARFHLGNGARLERINWMGNPSKRGIKESWGLMVNYLYDPAMIEANHEGFVRDGYVARSEDVDTLLRPPHPAPARRERKVRAG